MACQSNTSVHLSFDTTTFLISVRQNNMKMVSVLLGAKANPNNLHKTHKVPLLKAVKCAYVDIVKELLSQV